MRAILRTWVILAWGLWFGGLMAVFVVATAMFRAGHDVGAAANPILFAAFERYQLWIAGAAVIGATGWVSSRPSRGPVAVWMLLALAGAGAVVNPLWITPTIHRLQVEGRTKGAEFRAAHGRSMMIYAGEVALLLGAGAVLANAGREGSPRDEATKRGGNRRSPVSPEAPS